MEIGKSRAQAVLMSVFRTLRQRGHEPIQTLLAALTEYLATGHLPDLPNPQSPPLS